MYKFTPRFFLLFLLLSPAAMRAQIVSSNLPIIVIETEGGQPIPDEPKIKAHIGIIWNGDGQTNYLSNPFNHYDGDIGIEIRGSSSQSFDKKGYAVETRDPDGSDLDVPLFDFPKESDWVLHGPYSDKSLLRNAVAYTLAAWIMDYAPRVRFAEVIINGDYRGVYVFTEKIKRDANRVNISKLKPEDISGDKLTGGYILKFDKWDGADNDGFTSNYPADLGGFGTTWFLYHYPKPSEIAPEQKDYIQQYIHHLEDVLMSPGFADSLTGYRKYFDMESFIRYLFVQEMGKNVDAYRLSTFFYKDRDSKDPRLHSGPIWDFNLAFGNADYCSGWETSGWAWRFNDVCPGDFWVVHFWWERIWQDPAFRLAMAERWFSLRQDTLSNQRICDLTDSLFQLLQEPAARNFGRFDILGNYVWPNAFVGNTYLEEYQYLKNWLLDRLAWLDEQMTTFTGVLTPGDPGDEVTLAFPNPFSGSFHVSYYLPYDSSVHAQLYDARGALVAEEKTAVLHKGTNLTKFTGPFPPGVYCYRLRFANGSSTSGKVAAH